LNRFAEVFAPCGFRRQTLYPAYGLAEATLMVSGGMKAAEPLIHAARKTALAQHRVVSAHPDEAEAQSLVGCGQARLGQQIRIVDPLTCQPCVPGQVGEIWVAGPSVAQGYWNHPEATAQTFQAHLANNGEGPFLRTGDLGCLRDGELFVTGRLKDVMIIRGSNHYPQDIEQTMAQSHTGLRSGCGAAFSVAIEGEERLVVVQELERSYRSARSHQGDVREVMTAIRHAIAEVHGLQVHAILLLRAGSVPKTTSGKIQRQACKIGFLTRSLNVMSAWHAMPTPNRQAQPHAIPARMLLFTMALSRRRVHAKPAMVPADCDLVARAA
jgi:acyl-CoA synthetase (AMP-forming)/AMP-acid ligase II